MAAPEVTAWGDTKQLKFDWDPVPNAAYYQLLFHAPGSTTVFFTLSPAKTAATNNISAHLFDWDRWSYGVTACNSQGSCSEGRPEVAIKSLMQDTIGYFKPAVANPEGNFGHRVALAEDGNTFAVLSREEPVGSSRAAPFYVFTKIAGRWRQQARIFPSSTTPGLHNVGIDPYSTSGALALSQDGNTLMVTMPFRATRDDYYSNSVSIYRRTNNSWALEYQVVNPGLGGRTPSENKDFARMDLAGTRIVYRYGSGILQLLERGSAGWKVRDIPAPVDMDYCYDTRMSGDGKTIAYFCAASESGRVFLAKYPDWVPIRAFDPAEPRHNYVISLAMNYPGTMIAVGVREFDEVEQGPTDYEVRVYRQRDGAWQQFGNTLLSGSWSEQYGLGFGEALEFSRNGTYLAVSHRLDSGQGTGVQSPPLARAPGSPPDTYTGAVYVYEFPASGPRLRRVVKPNVAAAWTMEGMDFSLANDGKTLVIGQPNESSKATGIDGNRYDSSASRSGAAWLY
ncbi:MAG TPA: hypothetical protein VFL16_03365 [Steroidobacteraceae bacterium]|nr:hypothetical protein [Steroidobacteraceae bacterium]